ncbi:MAG: hypothetical protein ACXVA9_05630 [Bdellovibrionales bacterium]
MDFSRTVSQVVSLVFSITFSITMMVTAMSGSFAVAEPSRAIASSNSADHPSVPNSDSFQAHSNTRSLSQRDVIFRSLLSTEGKDLTWPSFPRTWHEQSVEGFVGSNTTLGLGNNVFGVGASTGVSIDYRWVLKSALVIIAGNRMEDDAQSDSHGVTLEPVDDPIKYGIFVKDYANHRSLPNVRKGYPMVAFCAFEASLNYGVSTKGGVQFMGNGELHEEGSVHKIVHTLFSRFFQVDGQLSPLQMLKSICADKFRKQVEQYVNEDFAMNVEEFTAYVNPGNECQPDPGNDGAQGDAGCMGWHQKNFDRATRAITVPRCTFVNSGLHKCQLTSRENGNCSMYWDKSQGKAVTAEMKVPGQYYSRATDSPLRDGETTARRFQCAVLARHRTLSV